MLSWAFPSAVSRSWAWGDEQWGQMTPKQKRFVAEYLIDHNATQAAIRAGYSERTAQQIGAENLLKPVIAAAVAEGEARIADKAEVTQDWLVAEFQENHRLAREHGPVKDRYGKPTNQLVQRNLSASNKALESIAVITGNWVEKNKVEGNVTIVVKTGIDGND